MTTDLIIALVLMLVGTVGAIVPVLPGPPIVWLGALYYAWQTNFVEIGYGTLLILGVLAIVGGTSELWLGYLGARSAGASGWATLASLVGGIIGLIVLNVVGLVVGSLVGIALVEYRRHGEWRQVARASGGYVAGWLLSMLVQVAICIAMIALFFIARSI